MNRLLTPFSAMLLALVSVSHGNSQAQRTALPKLSDLKTEGAASEGRQSPLAVVQRAIQAARADDIATLKTCFSRWATGEADQVSLSANNEKGRTNAQEVAGLLATMETEGMAEIAQTTRGDYAVVAARAGSALHMIRTVREEIDGEKPSHAWVLMSPYGADYRMDYNAPDARKLREAIEAADAPALKKLMEEDDVRSLELLSGMQEGVDPFVLLARRLQKVIKNAESPRVLLSRSGMGMQSTAAYWFAGESGSTFLAVQFVDDWDWEARKYTTRVRLNLLVTGQFHAKPAEHYRQFVGDYDW